MRLRKLGLRRYGKFTDTVLDFGARLEDGPDMHIVYGPNEAGKSTVMSAVMDLLYGIHTQSKLNFLHPYPTMRIEAEIAHSTGSRHVARIKKPQNSLLDDSDRPIPEAVLLGELGGLDRSAYQTMFCLDDETLEAGGENILASKGDLGTLLFSATAGLSDLSSRLASVREEADGFFRPGKRTGVLADLKRELANLKEERDRIDTLASEFSRLVTDRDEAAAAYDEAVRQRARTQSRIEEIGRLLHALPRLQAVRRLRADIEPLAALPEAPSAWATDLPDLMTRHTKLQTQAQASDEEITRLEHTIAASRVNEAACRLQDRIQGLMDMRARFVTAEKDLPERRLTLALAEQTVSRILTRINRASDPEPRRLILSTEMTGPLHDLIQKRSGIEAAIVGAEAELAKARDALSDAEARLGSDGGALDEPALHALGLAVGMARQSDDVARLRAADRTRQERCQEFEDALAELHPWAGDRNALLLVQVPRPDQLETWTSTDAKLSQDIALQHNDIDRLDREALKLQRKSEALASVAGAVSDREVAEIRSAREAAWALHKDRLDATTAASFETEMRKLDLVSEQRLSHVASVAELNQTLLDYADIRTRREHAVNVLETSLQQRELLAADVAASARVIGGGLEESISLAGLKLWLQKRERAIELRTRLMSAERESRQALTDVAAARERLAAALRAAGVVFTDDADIQALLAAGQAALDREAVAKALRADVDERRRDLRSREARRQEVLAMEGAWNTAWRQACAACWLGDNESLPTVATVRETLEALAELGPELEKTAGLTDRIAKMERDQIQFRAEVETLAVTMGLPAETSDVLELYHAVVTGVADATKTLERRQDAEAALLAERDEACELAGQLAQVQAQAQRMMDVFKVGSLTEVDICLRHVVRRSELTARLVEARDEMLKAIGLQTFEEAEAILDALDRAALEAELSERKSHFDHEDERTRDLFAAKTKADDRIAAIGGDAAVARIDATRRTLLLTIEDKARAYIRLKLGVAAADGALQVYRDRHRSSMMARASEAFSLISRGKYSELVTQSSNGSELLIAKAVDGSSKIASELSKGTRFQLYLALRVAGYHEFARAHAPAPFLADDIMETFDDFRAEEAFRLLSGMAMKGQVVYFTHHRHLCEIAKAVAPAAVIHELGSEMRVAS
ncbi:AAA family ATPase [Bradyrhizobium diazoefficiens]|nr:AAA family ATPase [Bradyrhizobium diazoefficiens]MBR0965357.1 AAA family ATPase [Bradyrhizobium diazoefficiens]MBR0980820.1 AAA family ATPase [Bradyrhizobium diazoefficiens]MBR1010614.1 AAA family ATPase [Bradyrhizobium diazoefficiens]MBR1016953.1 AAA family ATPase [Bradyrhizobium diazoefficiens]MBR1054360.1 AAA family ATPase [Bradyrhizobium diazoefficiens]